MTDRDEQAREGAQLVYFAQARRKEFAKLWRESGPTQQRQIATLIRMGLAWLKKNGGER
jgi:hypothetical protein